MKLKNPLLIAAAASSAVVIAVATSAPALAAPAPSPSSSLETVAAPITTTPSMTSEALVRAMFFGQGELATELAEKPGFWYLKDVAGHRLDDGQRAVINAVVADMQSQDPIAFDRAAARMTSGDPYIVATEMHRLNTSFEQAVTSVAETRTSDPLGEDPTIASPVVVVAVVFHAGVAVTGVAVGVVAVAVANSVVWHNQVKVTRSIDRPGGEERFLAEVTASLAA